MNHFCLAVLLVYVAHASALPVNNLQADSLVQQVAQGFSSEPPADLAQPWRATMLLVIRTERKTTFASGFVVRRGAGFVELLTVNHLVEGVCTAECPELTIYPDGGITRTEDQYGTKYDWIPELPNTRARLVKRDRSADLALIRISVPDTFDVAPVVFADQNPSPGTEALAFGFPRLGDLPDRARYDRPTLITRRWSQGQILNDRNYEMGAGVYTTTTIDGHLGVSGGPIVDVADGTVIGVAGISGRIKQNRYAYNDSPTGLNQGLQAAAIPLARVRAFLGLGARQVSSADEDAPF